MHIALMNMSGPKCVWQPSCQAHFPSCVCTTDRSLLSWRHQCHFRPIFCHCRRPWYSFDVCKGLWCCASRTCAPSVANSNHKIFVQKMKFSKTVLGERRDHIHCHCLKGKEKRGKHLDDLLMPSPAVVLWEVVQWSAFQTKMSKPFLLETLFWHIRPYCFDHSPFQK